LRAIEWVAMRTIHLAAIATPGRSTLFQALQHHGIEPPRRTAPRPGPIKRKPRLDSALNHARRAGHHVSGATIGPDGKIELRFGEPDNKVVTADNEAEAWIRKHAH
jgi:hypothetical protein